MNALEILFSSTKNVHLVIEDQTLTVYNEGQELDSFIDGIFDISLDNEPDSVDIWQQTTINGVNCDINIHNSRGILTANIYLIETHYGVEETYTNEWATVPLIVK